MLTKEDVTAAYRLILGRSPENEATIQMQINTNEDFVRLRHSLLTSDEFLKKLQDDAVLQGAMRPAAEVMSSVPQGKSKGRRGFSLRSGRVPIASNPTEQRKM